MEHVSLWIRIRLWLLDHIPDGMLHQPEGWFFGILCAYSGALNLFTGVESASLEAVLPYYAYKAWGVLLLVGGIALIVGVQSIKSLDEGSTYVVTRLAYYRLGLRLLAISTTVFVGAIIYFAGFSAGITASAIPIAFILACSLRLLTLGGRRQ